LRVGDTDSSEKLQNVAAQLNFEMMSRPTLMAYHRELCEIARDAMSSEERQRYRAVRERVATLLAFPR